MSIRIHCPGIFRLRNLRLLLYKLHNSSRTGECILKLCNNARNLIEGLGILVSIAEHTGELTDTDSAMYCEYCAHKCNKHVHNTVYESC